MHLSPEARQWAAPTDPLAQVILRYSANPLLDVGLFYEQVLFSFLTGNADMHLKNFSLIDRPGMGWTLAPAYDMFATALVNPLDTDELALTLDGKKKNLTRRNFLQAFQRAGLGDKTSNAIFRRFERAIPQWMIFIRNSPLPKSMQEQFTSLIRERVARMELYAG